MTNKGIRYGLTTLSLLLLVGFQAHARTLSIGTVGSVALYNGTGSCPTNDAFFTPKTGSAVTIICYSATVSCRNVDDASVVFGVINPNQKLPPNGTIILHSCCTGQAAFNPGNPAGGDAVTEYTRANYRVVQVAWPEGWENVANGYSPNLKYAACRPATVFQYIHHTYTNGATCLEGWSAGSAAIAYSLKDYGASQYVDKAVLLAGPPMSDMEQACEVTSDTIQVWPAAQFGMTYTSPDLISPSWSPRGSAQGFAASWGRSWTGSNACDGTTTNTHTQDSAWKAMSIVDGIAEEGTYSYPQTALSIWLPGPDSNGGNPSCISAQGEIYARNFTSARQVAGGCTTNMGYYNYNGPCFSVNEVGGVNSMEIVWSGTSVNGVTTSANTAIINDMTDSVVGCINRH